MSKVDVTASPLFLQPGDVIGILGGGQLGRMLSIAAANLGFKCHIYCQDTESPALETASRYTIAPYDDEKALIHFARQCHVVTYEFENLPLHSVDLLSSSTTVRPGLEPLKITQDRLLEKRFLNDAGLAVAPFRAINGIEDLRSAMDDIGLPAILKTRLAGYDGKGQVVIRHTDQADAAWKAIDQQPAILEAMINFQKEISVLIARGQDGQIAIYDPPENEHRDGVLYRSRIPARIDENLSEEAKRIAGTIVTAFDYIGLLTVELFVQNDTGTQRVLVNEIAPRVHNSGHWTMDACVTGQFEQHIRAIAGWPLARPCRHSDVIMENLIGTDIERWPDIVRTPQAALHIYGKTETRPGRKMGHVNYLASHSNTSSYSI